MRRTAVPNQFRTAALIALVWVVPRAASAAPEAEPQMADLGSYERRALDRALEREGLEIEPQPQGKRVRQVHVVNLDVFGPDSGFLQWFNIFHRTTREDVLAREVLITPGDLWDADKVEETMRRLRNPLYSTLAVIVAVKPPATAPPGTVDVLVVTRDVWSLRMNSRYALQATQLAQLAISVSENNLFGRRKTAAFVFDMDLGDYSLGPLYLDSNIAGTHLQLLAQAAAIFSRETGEFEGSEGTIVLEYPFWSLDRDWSTTVSVVHYDAIVREFQGEGFLTYDAPETEADDAIPWIYAHRTLDVQWEVVRGFGDAVEHRVGLGYALSLSRPEIVSRVAEILADDPALEAAFVRDVLPRSERTAAIFARYRLFTPTYAEYRNIDSFDLTEDRKLGPDAELRVGAALPILGSEPQFLFGQITASYAASLGETGIAEIAASAATRVQNGDAIDNEVVVAAEVVSPPVFGAFRLAGRALGAARFDEESNLFYSVGGLSGLRGYPIGAFTGQRKVLLNAELRTLPIPIWVLRAGGIAFWDAGHAAETFDELGFYHDVGVGLRLLVPQLSSLIYRFDWAVPVAESGFAWPGRITAGIEQIF